MAKFPTTLKKPLPPLFLTFIEEYHLRYNSLTSNKIFLRIFSCVWFTVHLNRMIVYFYYQLDAQILYFNTFVIFLYMFRALLRSSSGEQIVLVQYLVPSLTLGNRSVHRLRESSRRSTRCRTNTNCSPEDERNSARNMYSSIINVLK